jgi:hypothetical protein
MYLLHRTKQCHQQQGDFVVIPMIESFLDKSESKQL